MPFDPSEIVTLSTEAVELYDELAVALRKDDDGRVRVTRAELRRIGKAALGFAFHALRDWLD